MTLEEIDGFKLASFLAHDFTKSPGKCISVIGCINSYKPHSFSFEVKSWVGTSHTIELQTDKLSEAIDKYNSL